MPLAAVPRTALAGPLANDLRSPPLNIFGPDTVPQLNEVITALETGRCEGR